LYEAQRAVGHEIQKIRRRRGITQDELAEMAGLNRAHLYRIEAGKRNVTLKTLAILADALGVRIRDLVRTA